MMMSSWCDDDRRQAYWTFEGTCETGNRAVSLGALAMYASYLYLFIDFFFQVCCHGGSQDCHG